MVPASVFVLFLYCFSRAAGQPKYPFLDTKLTWNARVDDLVNRLTLDEMQEQMARGGTGPLGGPAPAVPRLGIGRYQFVAECVSGVARATGNATSFPEPIGMAASFSPSLMHSVSSAIGTEVRGKHNDYVKQGMYSDHTGASCFSPVINIVRDPRWGRIEETYGEDPFLSGILAQEFVKGLQGNHSRFVQATAGCKHFDVHGGPEALRNNFNAQVSDFDWRMTFLPAFRKCVQAGTFSLMCSYNSINGVPACANKKLLTDILRTEWNFQGYVISDQNAMEYIQNQHHYTTNSVDSAAAAANAGCNIELGASVAKNVYTNIVEAVKQGKLTEAVVRERVKPLFLTRMRLGEFDPPENNPYAQLNSKVAESPQHIALAIEAASKTFVLLKNLNNILPLKVGEYKNVGIIGPFADNPNQLVGDYHTNTDRSFTMTPLQGLREIFKNAKTNKACVDKTPCRDYHESITKETVTGTDLVFVVLGTGTAVEHEGIDRPSLELPGQQKQLLEDVIKYSVNAKIILLLFNAGPVNVSFADDSNRVDAIMECFYPGQSTGRALINVLTNKDGKSSPAGRLPVTWPKLATQLGDFTNYGMEGRTYRYLMTDPLYPFGYGLSYSTFTYDHISVTDLKSPKENLDASVTVTNKGNLDADEVIQCYIAWGNKSLHLPQRQLVYFNRVHLTAGQQLKQSFQILWDNFAFRDNNGWTVQAGSMTLYCGGQQPGQHKSAPSNVLSVQFTIPSTVHMSVL